MKTLRMFSLILTALFVTSACISAGPTPTGSATPQNSPTPSPQPTQQPALPAEAPQTFVVLASRGWDTTGIYLRPGQSFEVAAFGSWSKGPDGDSHGPDGVRGEDSSSPDFILPSARAGALIGRIGFNPPFEIGEHVVLTADNGGELWVGINDRLDSEFDNSGSLEVTVSLGPEPAEPTQIITNELDGYRLLVPAGYQVVIYNNGMCLTTTGAWRMACHLANAYIEVGDAGGRKLSEVAEDEVGDANPDVPVRRTSLTVSGLDAVLLDDIYTYDVLRKVVLVQDERTYILTFVPWSDQGEDFPQLEHLFNTVISSFTLRPQPEATYPTEKQVEHFFSVVNPVTIYSGPGREHPPLGVLEARASVGMIGGQDGDFWPDRWLKIACPEDLAGECWVLWDMNALHSSEGPPVALNIPDPASLKIEYTNTYTSPDERWQALASESEQVSLDGDLAFFFYVELTVTSLVDGTTWRPVSEWHVAGLGHETAPRPFHWSQDGRYLYYTSDVVPDGGCGFFANSGESLNRLDLRDGSVSVLQPPYNHWMLSISPDESRLAYLTLTDGYHLVVRDLEGAYSAGSAGQDSIQWQSPLDLAAPRVVSQINWSPDGQKVLVTVAEIAGNCQPARATEWELELASGDFVEGTTMLFPTPTP